LFHGGGWGCIYSHQPLPSRWAILLSADGPPSWCGRSAPVDQRLKNATVSSNGYINGYIAFNASSDVRQSQSRTVRSCTPDGPVVHPGRSARPSIIHFSEPVTFGFFGFLPTGRSAPEAGRSARGLGRSLLFLRTVCSGNLCFCIGSVRRVSRCRGRSAAGARTVRAWPIFPKSFSCPE
jgi:hypothetical protein